MKPVRVTLLLTKEAFAALRGRAFRYGRDLLMGPDTLGIGRAPYSHIDAETIAQRAFSDGYITALRDERKLK